MSDKTEQDVSALLDDELSNHQLHDLADKLEQDQELKDAYSRYALVSDVLHNHVPDSVDIDFSQHVSKALQQEPTVLGGFKQRYHLPVVAKQIAGLAMAASVTAVAILGIQSYSVSEQPAAPVIASVPVAPAAINDSDWIRVNGVNWNNQEQVESRLNNYLVNHHVYSSGMQGILPYAKIVSYQRNGNEAAASAAEIYKPGSKTK